jgi:putative transposase
MFTELSSIIMSLVPVMGCNVETFIEMTKGIYCISSGGVTQENISRWTGRFGSYRSLHRLMQGKINWLALSLLLFNTYWMEEPDPTRHILAVDEVVTKKAGKRTFGVAWFYSSIAGKAIRSICFHAVSVVDTQKERSFSLHQIQNVKAAASVEKVVPKKKKPAPQKGKKAGPNPVKKTNAGEKGKAGRPKGSKNKEKTQEPSPLSQGFKALLDAVLPPLALIGLHIKYVAADGAYGNKTCMLICMELNVHLLSKLNCNSALFLPYTGKYSGKGRHSKYGDQLVYGKLPDENLKSTKIEKGTKTQIFQFKEVWSKNLPTLINVVIIQKTNVESGKMAQAILFTTDLALDWDKIILYYSMRFQIEFNFRDAKQYFGLADLKNIKEQSVKNAVGMAFFMNNISLILREKANLKYQIDDCSVQDLKAIFRADFYLQNILNTLDFPNKPILTDPIFSDIAKIGAVNLKKKAA